MGEAPRRLAFLDRAVASLWRAFGSTYVDAALGAVGVSLGAVWLILSFAREPLAGTDLHTLAQAVWMVRPVRAAAVGVATLACWRLLGLLSPAWVSPPRLRSATSIRFLHLESLPRAECWRSVGLAPCRTFHTPQERLIILRRYGGADCWSILLPLGLLFLLGALALQAGWGRHTAPAPLLLGHSLPLLESEEAYVTLDELDVLPKGANLARLEAHLSLRKDDQILGGLDLRRGPSRTIRGVTLYLTGYGPAMRLRAFKQGGESEQPLLLLPLANSQEPQAVVRLAFIGQQEHQVALTSHRLVVRLIYYPAESGEPEQAALWHVQALSGQDGQILAEGFANDQPLHLVVRQVRFVAAPEYYILLSAERRVAQPLFAIGALFSLIGLIARFLWPPRLVWLGLRQEGEVWVGEVRTTSPSLLNAVRQALSEQGVQEDSL